ncbi:MAG: tetratricopeptide repeat protein, partial [Myxococcota bacterium]
FVAQQGDLQEALRLHQRALQSYEAALGPDHPEVAACLEHLGRALTHADRTAEALAHHHRALEIRLATLGAAHRDVAMSHLRIGQAHARAGAVDEARVWFDRARPVLVRELPEGDPDRAAAVAGPEPNPI